MVPSAGWVEVSRARPSIATSGAGPGARPGTRDPGWTSSVVDRAAPGAIEIQHGAGLLTKDVAYDAEPPLLEIPVGFREDWALFKLEPGRILPRRPVDHPLD